MKTNKTSFIVEIKETRRVLITVDNCTEEEARENPYQFSVDEHEMDVTDWEVLNVCANK